MFLKKHNFRNVFSLHYKFFNYPFTENFFLIDY